MPSKQFGLPLLDVVPERDTRVVRCYAEHLEGLGLSDRKTSLLISTARHVAVWLALNGAGLDKLDVHLLDRFMRHECHCPGRHRNGRKPGQHCRRFALRFLRYLLETGRAEVPPEIEAGGHLATRFRDSLEEQGYASSTIRSSGTLCRHFIVWLYLSDIPLAEADERVQRRFLAHDCTCVHPGFLDRPTGFAGSRTSGSTLRLFAAFLVDRNVIPAPVVPQRHAEHGEHLDAFLHWLRQHRGLRDTTIEQYERHMRALLPALGDDPGAYDAARVRNTILDRLETASRGQVGDQASALRMYLRFLGSNGLCRPELVHAVPTVPRLRGESLPRHVGQDDIERMIATCDVTTPMGMRDRAALLLLARLALRAGDVAGLNLDDIDWDRAVIRVKGKSRRETELPLPQDVGDALRNYILEARPRSDEKKVFLRCMAPHRPLANNSISTSIVCRAVERAGIRGVGPTASHLFRRSAATNLLRDGAPLEAIGTLLRHSSPDVTAIYARVDVRMLRELVQPWPFEGDDR
ncbi:MAG: tyrosine-type recombinase/integrase [Gammaproteobacteria bacterium]|nr:tyrosine-type recombinase/integrase [Gammaproteobacteria bacterium]